MIEDGKPSLTGQFEVHMVNLKRNSGLPSTSCHRPGRDRFGWRQHRARGEMGSIKVGPESASSVPGPICYATRRAAST